MMVMTMMKMIVMMKMIITVMMAIIAMMMMIMFAMMIVVMVIMFAMMIVVMVTLVRSNPSLFASKAARCSEEAEDLSLRGSTSNLRSNS